MTVEPNDASFAFAWDEPFTCIVCGKKARREEDEHIDEVIDRADTEGWESDSFIYIYEESHDDHPIVDFCPNCTEELYNPLYSPSAWMTHRELGGESILQNPRWYPKHFYDFVGLTEQKLKAHAELVEAQRHSKRGIKSV